MKRALHAIAIVCLLGSAAAAEPAEPGAAYTAVQQAFLREDFQAVSGLGQAFVSQYPDAPQASRVMMWLALSLDRLNQPDAALAQLQAISSRLEPGQPLWEEALYWEGDISRRASNAVQAKTAFSNLLKHSPESSWAAQARIGLGMVYLSQQAFREALEQFQQVVASARPQGPMAMEARMLEGICLLRLERFGDAVAVLGPLMKQLPTPDGIAQAAFYVGESFAGMKRFDSAMSSYQHAIEAAPASFWGHTARFGLGWSAFQRGRCEDAVAAITEYLEAAGDRAEHELEARFAQGSCLATLGRDAEAVPLLRQVLGDHPQEPIGIEAGVALAQIARRQGNLEQAAQILEQVADHADESRRGELRLRAAALYLERGDALAAKWQFEQAARSADEQVQQAAISGLGDVEMFHGRYDRARQRYQSVSQVSPYAAFQVGRIDLLQGRIEQAIERFQSLSEPPDSPVAQDARLALALAYISDHQPERAQEQLHQIRQHHRGTGLAARAAFYLALAAYDAQDHEQARRLCREAISGSPGSEEAVDARIFLAQLESARSPLPEIIAGLRAAYQAPSTAPRHRPKLAKILGDLSRQQADYRSAIRWYELATASPVLRAEAWYRTASCYEEAGDLDVAIGRYRALSEPPWLVKGQLAAARLLERLQRWDEAASIYASLAEQPVPEAKAAQEALTQLREQEARHDH